MKPKEKVCGLCKKAETSPKDKNPVLLTAWSAETDQYVCSCCYRGLENLNELGKAKIKIVDILSPDADEDYEDD